MSQLRSHTGTILVLVSILQVLLARAAVYAITVLPLGPAFTPSALLFFLPLALVHNEHAGRTPFQARPVGDAGVPQTSGRDGIEG